MIDWTIATTSARVPLVIGCTASRKGLVDEQAEQAIKVLRAVKGRRRNVEFHHGGCVGGDVQLAAMAKALGCKTVRHPGDTPQWQDLAWHDDVVLEPKGNLQRNRVIVMASALMICAPRSFEQLRGSGTWAAIRECRRTKTPHVLVWPPGIWADGKTYEEHLFEDEWVLS